MKKVFWGIITVAVIVVFPMSLISTIGFSAVLMFVSPVIEEIARKIAQTKKFGWQYTAILMAWEVFGIVLIALTQNLGARYVGIGLICRGMHPVFHKIDEEEGMLWVAILAHIGINVLGVTAPQAWFLTLLVGIAGWYLALREVPWGKIKNKIFKKKGRCMYCGE